MEGEKEGGAGKIKGGGHNTVYRQQSILCMYSTTSGVDISVCHIK